MKFNAKFIKVLLLLLLVVLNNSISSLEISKLHKLKNYSKIMSNKNSKKSNRYHHNSEFNSNSHLKSHISKSYSHKNHRKYNSNTDSKTEVGVKTMTEIRAQTKLMVGMIVFGLTMAFRVGSEVLNHYTNKMNQQTLNLMKQERNLNDETKKKIINLEVDGCTKIKLITHVSRTFFILSEIKMAFASAYLYKKPSIILQENKNINSVTWSKEQFRKMATEKNVELLNSITNYREKIKKFSDQLLNTLKKFEENACMQDNKNADLLNTRNQLLDPQIEQIEKEMEQKESSMLDSVLTSSFSSVMEGNDHRNYQDYHYTSVTWVDKNSSEQAISIDINYIGGFANSIIGTLKGTKDFIAFIKTFRDTSEKRALDWIILITNTLNFITSLLSSIQYGLFTQFDLGVSAIVKNTINLASKLLEAGVAVYLYHNCKVEQECLQEEKEKLRLDMIKAFIEVISATFVLCLSPISGVISEGLHFIRRIAAFSRAKKRLKKQTKEFTFYNAINQIILYNATKKTTYNVCMASYHATKTTFEIILEMLSSQSMSEDDLKIFFEKIMVEDINVPEPTTPRQPSQSMEDNNKKIQNELSKYDLIKSNSDFQTKMNILKDHILSLCQKNVHFCARNFSDAALSSIGLDNQIENLKEMTINGPYSDLVVCQDQETCMSFIKLGFEPISPKILGCRLCSGDMVIRHVEIVSNEPQDDTRFKNLQDGKSKDGVKICQAFYNENQQTCRTLMIKSMRIDENNYLFYELVSTNKLVNNNFIQENEIEALYRFSGYSLKDKLRNQTNPRSYYFQAVLKNWMPVNKSWKPCNSLQSQINCSNYIRLIKPDYENDSYVNTLVVANHQEDQDFEISAKGSCSEIAKNIWMIPLMGPNKLMSHFDSIKDIPESQWYMTKSDTGSNPTTSVTYSDQIFFSYRPEIVGNSLKYKKGMYNWFVLSDFLPSETMKQLESFLIRSNDPSIINYFDMQINIYNSNSNISGLYPYVDYIPRSIYMVQFAPFTNNNIVQNVTNDFECSSMCETPDTRTKENTICQYAEDLSENDVFKIDYSESSQKKIQNILMDSAIHEKVKEHLSDEEKGITNLRMTSTAIQYDKNYNMIVPQFNSNGIKVSESTTFKIGFTPDNTSNETVPKSNQPGLTINEYRLPRGNKKAREYNCLLLRALIDKRDPITKQDIQDLKTGVKKPDVILGEFLSVSQRNEFFGKNYTPDLSKFNMFSWSPTDKEDDLRPNYYFVHTDQIRSKFYIVRAVRKHYTTWKDVDTREILELILEKMPGYVIVTQLLLKKPVKYLEPGGFNYSKSTQTAKEYIFVLVKPLANYGYVPLPKYHFEDKSNLIDYSHSFGKKLLSKKAVNIYPMDLSEEPIWAFKPYNFGKNLVLNQRMNSNFLYLMTLNTRFLTTPSSLIEFHKYLKTFSFQKFKTIFMYVPISFHYNYEWKSQYRKLDFVKIPSGNETVVDLKETYDNFGPGIKKIYYLRIATSKDMHLTSPRNREQIEIHKYDALAIDELTKAGYSFLHTSEQNVQTFKNGNYGDITLYFSLYVAYDYRLKESRKTLCEICLKVKNKLMLNK